MQPGQFDPIHGEPSRVRRACGSRPPRTPAPHAVARRSSGGRAARLTVLSLAALAALVGCRKNEPNQCRIDYELVGGNPSERFDILYATDGGRRIVREIYAEGRGSDLQAIYYYFNDAGLLEIEALDTDANGDIEARMDVRPAIGRALVPYAVDLEVQDGQVDALQISMRLPSALVGAWNPGRIYYQIPCDQGRAEVSSPSSDVEVIDFYLDNTDDVRTRMTVTYTDDGRPTGWTIDTNMDGEANDYASFTYNDRGQVREVFWTRPGTFMGDTYVLARYTYATDGTLYSWEADMNGDGVWENRITYSSPCFQLPNHAEVVR